MTDEQVVWTYPAGRTILKSATGITGNVVLTVPSNKRWIFKHALIKLNTSANSGTRTIYLRFRDISDKSFAGTKNFTTTDTSVTKSYFINSGSAGNDQDEVGEIILDSGEDIVIFATLVTDDTLEYYIRILELDFK